MKLTNTVAILGYLIALVIYFIGGDFMVNLGRVLWEI